MFSTEYCFEKHNKSDKSPCSLKRCDGPILPNLCLGTRANHERYYIFIGPSHILR